MEQDHRRLTVSFTSYPARIRFVPTMLSTLLRQTCPADRIVLYLSEDQFPGKETELPEELQNAQKENRLQIRWVSGDLKPHKKYIYAFRDFPEDIVVTVDDDILYAPELLDQLWQAHLEHPGAVVAGRTHLITLDKNGHPNPYAQWIHCTQGFDAGPSMQLIAIGIAGVLYDPKLFPPELFDEESIHSLCLEADDLWLKAMELVAGVPVIRASNPELIRTIADSQETALYLQNLNENRNDVFLTNVISYIKEVYGKDLVTERLNDPAWHRLEDEPSLFEFLNTDRRRILTAANICYGRLERAKEEIKKSKKRAEDLEDTIQALRESSSYRLGNKLIAPISKIKGLFKK